MVTSSLRGLSIAEVRSNPETDNENGLLRSARNDVHLSPSLPKREGVFGGAGGGLITIDISHLASGLYFLKIGNKTVKVVKE